MTTFSLIVMVISGILNIFVAIAGSLIKDKLATIEKSLAKVSTNTEMLMLNNVATIAKTTLHDKEIELLKIDLDEYMTKQDRCRYCTPG